MQEVLADRELGDHIDYAGYDPAVHGVEESLLAAVGFDQLRHHDRSKAPANIVRQRYNSKHRSADIARVHVQQQPLDVRSSHSANTRDHR